MSIKRPILAAESIFRSIKALSPTQAYLMIEKALKADPSNEKLLCKSVQLLANPQNQKGGKREALERLAECLERMPNNPGAWTTAMIVYAQFGEDARAIDAAREGLKQAPDKYVYNKAAEVLSNSGLHSEAVAAIKKGMEQYLGNWRLETTALKVFAEAGEKDLALSLIDYLETRDRKDDFLRTTMANVLLGYNESERAWNIIKSPRPKDLKGLTVHAHCALSRDDLRAAKEDLDMLLSAAPQEAYTHQLEARIAYCEGRFAPAISSFNRFIMRADKPCPFDALIYISITADDNPVSQNLRTFFAHKPPEWLDRVVGAIRTGHMSYAQIEAQSRAKLTQTTLLADGGVATRVPVNQVSRIAARPSRA